MSICVGSQRPSQIDEEDEEEEEESSDDDRTIYSDYYLPPEYMREVKKQDYFLHAPR
jgi:hypothetical protein